ncbi:C40 family peptidase [Streptomyces anandii]|uniref:C40 family peptidase n=1 Tax=Streptomyces anandii TaxID=285454 RepID=UPI0036861695
MAVQDFLATYQNAMLNKKLINPLNTKNTSLPVAKLNIDSGQPEVTQSPGYGEKIPTWLQGRTSSALQGYMTKKADRTTELASKYTDMAAGNIPTDKYGIPTDKLTDFSGAFNSQLNAISDTGKAAVAKAESAAQWQTLQRQAEQSAGYNVTWAPGASGNNPGAKAVSIAMQAVNNHTPYVWAGNSLTTGVDCSGLVQQVYNRLGISLPRSTYEQAKSGKVVSVGSLLPGDLVFYNTGSRDPNGIGTLSHVAIYIGNGQVIDAPGRGKTVRITSLNNSGTPARAIRPW